MRKDFNWLLVGASLVAYLCGAPIVALVLAALGVPTVYLIGGVLLYAIDVTCGEEVAWVCLGLFFIVQVTWGIARATVKGEASVASAKGTQPDGTK